MKSVPLLAVLFLSVPLSAAADETVFRGTMGERTGVLVSVDMDARNHLGTIHYDASGEDGLSLIGSPSPDGGFQWTETLDSRGMDEPRQTGIFKGKLYESGVKARGTWTQAGGKKTLPFELERVAVLKSLESKEVDADVDFPQFDPPQFRQLNDKLAAEARKDLEEQVRAIRELREELKDLDSEVLERLGSASTCTAESVEKNLVSLGCSLYEYSGGAHGNTNLSTRNYGIGGDGSVISIDLWDVLKSTAPARASLSALLIEALKAQGASSVVEGEIKDFRSELEKDELSFSIVPAGLAFHFSPYSVGAYAEGSFRVVLPNRALKDLFRRDGPLGERAGLH